MVNRTVSGFGEENTCQQFLYVIQRDSETKIGISYEPEKRIKSIRREKPLSNVDVIKIMRLRNAFWVEKYVHSKLAQKRMHGEWFVLNTTDIKLVLEFCNNFLYLENDQVIGDSPTEYIWKMNGQVWKCYIFKTKMGKMEAKFDAPYVVWNYVYPELRVDDRDNKHETLTISP